MTENPIALLSFIAGPAILANACTILQNGAATRHSLAVGQWRDFHASLVAHDQRLPMLYTDPSRILSLSERRIRLQLRQTELLLVAACLFATTSFLALASTMSTLGGAALAATVTAYGMFTAGGLGLALMITATAIFWRESACTREMLSLHSKLLTPHNATTKPPAEASP